MPHPKAGALAQPHGSAWGRRGVLGALAALLTAPAATSPTTASGRKRRRKRKKRKSQRACQSGQSRCQTGCATLAGDSANCGACGVVCGGGQTCVAGACACPAGQSFVFGACVSPFGCTAALDSCTAGKRACPDILQASDAQCFTTADGQPFCATAPECGAFTGSGDCPPILGKARGFTPCAACIDPGDTGVCLLLITKDVPSA